MGDNDVPELDDDDIFCHEKKQMSLDIESDAIQLECLDDPVELPCMAPKYEKKAIKKSIPTILSLPVICSKNLDYVEYKPKI